MLQVAANLNERGQLSTSSGDACMLLELTSIIWFTVGWSLRRCNSL